MDTILWRYFDLLKFFDLLSGNLHFSRADKWESDITKRLVKKLGFECRKSNLLDDVYY